MLLAFDDDGPGPVVALIHGFPLDRTMWEPQLEEVGSLYRVIAPDLRGCGESAVPDGVYTVDLLADDVIDTLDALEITEPIVVGGLSMGGYVAMSLALRYPARFRGLMLMNTRSAADPPSTALVREELAQIVEQTGKPDAVVDSMLPKLFSPATYTKRPEIIGPVKDQMMRSNPRGLANILRGLAIRPDRTAELGRIGVPTLVLAGVDDQMIPVEESKRLAEGIPGARLVMIPDGGHLATLENKAATNAAILEFLRSLGE
jgi:pimeloyl-ACP methyl ester carboxylesterase